MKKILIFIFIICLFFSFLSYGAETTNCKYSGEIEECLNSQDSPRTIEDFVCVQGGTGTIIYQVVLDKKFKEIDKKIEEYLDSLEKGKGYYFGPNKKEEFTEGTNDIEKYLGDGGDFEKLYKKLCDGVILAEAIDCSGGYSANIDIKDYLKQDGSQTKCKLAYDVTLLNYKDEAYRILKDNKAKIMKDNHKLFTQKQRTKLDEFVDLIRINLSYLERLGAKWQSKTKYPN